MTRDELYDMCFDLRIENDKLRALACYLLYVRPHDPAVIDELVREVGLKVGDIDYGVIGEATERARNDSDLG